MGFLYDPYNRSAPWWAIHDVVLKMLLTGMLIYVPEEERAAIATILCVVAIANLNYFRPHKSLLLFWLSQLSFLITSTKYIFAMVLSLIDQDGSPDVTELLEHFYSAHALRLFEFPALRHAQHCLAMGALAVHGNALSSVFGVRIGLVHEGVNLPLVV